MFDNIEILRDLERQRQEIVAIERQLCEPLLTDTKYIHPLYTELTNHFNIKETETRQVFILLVLLFYSPKKLFVGTKISERVMNAMCRATGCSQTLLSHNSKNLLFFYQHYKSFKDTADKAIQITMQVLLEQGVAKEMIRDYIWRFKVA